MLQSAYSCAYRLQATEGISFTMVVGAWQLMQKRSYATTYDYHTRRPNASTCCCEAEVRRRTRATRPMWQTTPQVSRWKCEIFRAAVDGGGLRRDR